MDKLVDLFQDFIKRAIAPSAVFFFLLAVAALVDGVFHEKKTTADLVPWLEDLVKSDLAQDLRILGALAFVVVLGTSYVLSLLHQVIFDGTLRRNFDALWSRSETDTLVALREKVVARTQDDLHELHQALSCRFNDYLLYEILGGIDPSSTRLFVDRAKSTGITFVSSMLVLVLWAAHLSRGFQPFAGCLLVLGLLVVLALLWVVGREVVKTEYRARAVRLYVNFLMMPRQRLDALLLSGGRQSEISEPTPKKT